MWICLQERLRQEEEEKKKKKKGFGGLTPEKKKLLKVSYHIACSLRHCLEPFNNSEIDIAIGKCRKYATKF